MTPEQWNRVREVFASALECAGESRSSYVERACAGDPELRLEVERMLEAHENTASLQTPLAKFSLAGQTISHYEVIQQLGAGGMGIVYKARDTALQRNVALKVLPPELRSDPDRRKRFIREAQAASALNHPNIAAVHDIVEHEGAQLIVMEYVDGETLDRRIPARGMPLQEALAAAIQIAGALAHAHNAGLVHRDLKPANIMITRDGTAKVLDFGLAKFLSRPQLGGSTANGPAPESGDRPAPTFSTEQGVIAGTVSYMAPEQAQGRPADARSDVFSFGAVLYEMVTGRRAFAEENPMANLAAIIHQEPAPPSKHSPEIPPELERWILRCLRKDPARRPQHMDDVKLALEELKEELSAGGPTRPRPATMFLSKRFLWPAAMILLGAAGVALWNSTRPATQVEQKYFATPITSLPGEEKTPSFSPDGSQIAFAWDGGVGQFDIYVKAIGEGEPIRVTSTPTRSTQPLWSPDGRYIAYWEIGENEPRFALMLIPALGGATRELLRSYGYSTPYADEGFSWMPDGRRILVSLRTQLGGTASLTLVDIDTLRQSEVRMLDPAPFAIFTPAVSADGRQVAFLADLPQRRGFWLQRMNTAFEPADLPRQLDVPIQDVWHSQGSFGSRAAWDPGGTSLLLGAERRGMFRIPVSGSDPLSQVVGTTGAVRSVAVSPRTGRIAYESPDFPRIEVYRQQLSREGGRPSAPEPVIVSGRRNYNPMLSPDARRIVVGSDRAGSYEIWVCNADGSGCLPVTKGNNSMLGSPRWSPDGARIVFDGRMSGRANIYEVSAGGGELRRLTFGGSWNATPCYSPDGRWIYFASDRKDGVQIWRVRASGGEPEQITTSGGFSPFLSADGRTLYYLRENTTEGTPLMAVPVEGGAEQEILPSVFRRNFALTPKGIYYVPFTNGEASSDLHYLDLQTGKFRMLTRLPFLVNMQLTTSADGVVLYFESQSRPESDIIMLEPIDR